MSHHCLFAVTLAVFCTLPDVAAAQTAPAIARGARVRIVIPAEPGQPERHIVGNLVRLEYDTAVIASPGLPLTGARSVAIDGGRRLEVLTGSRGRGGRGAAVGGVVGGVAGALVGGFTWEPCEGEGFFDCLMYPTQGSQVMGGAVLGVAAGALVGLVIGSSIRTETWAPLRTAGVRIAVTPRTAGLSLSF